MVLTQQIWAPKNVIFQFWFHHTKWWLYHTKNIFGALNALIRHYYRSGVVKYSTTLLPIHTANMRAACVQQKRAARVQQKRAATCCPLDDFAAREGCTSGYAPARQTLPKGCDSASPHTAESQPLDRPGLPARVLKDTFIVIDNTILSYSSLSPHLIFK